LLKGGILGFGKSGQFFTRWIRENCSDVKIVAACNRGREKLLIAEKEFGLLPTQHPQELVEMGIDFVIVSSTNYAHEEHALIAAAAGKHIFCEKPLALSLSSADRMIEAVEKSGVINVVNYSMRFNPAFVEIKKIIEQGKIGQVMMAIQNRFRGFGLYAEGARHQAIVEPEESGGWAIHHLCHSVDLLLWLVGPVKEVEAKFQSTFKEKKSEEVIGVMLKFTSGAIGLISDSVAKMRDHFTAFIGTKGGIALHGERERTLLKLQLEGEQKEEILPVSNQKNPPGALVHFLNCLRKNQKSTLDFKKAKESLKVCLKIKQSAETDQVVEV
jgi:predicted dehydrogenase